MDCLNFIFGLRAVNTTSTEEKQLSMDCGIFNSTQASVQKSAFFDEDDLKEENFTSLHLEGQEIHEVIC